MYIKINTIICYKTDQNKSKTLLGLDSHRYEGIHAFFGNNLKCLITLQEIINNWKINIKP